METIAIVRGQGENRTSSNSFSGPRPSAPVCLHRLRFVCIALTSFSRPSPLPPSPSPSPPSPHAAARRSSEKPTPVCNFQRRSVRDFASHAIASTRALAHPRSGSTLACYLPRVTPGKEAIAVSLPTPPRPSSSIIGESARVKVDRVREHGRHDKTHKVIHGEGSFITSYIAGLHCLGMLLSASVSRRITSSVRRYTRVSTPFPCPLAARASAPSFEGGFIRGTCSMILIISSLPTRITEICYRRR